MSTVLLVLGLLVGLGLVTFLITLGLTGLGALLCWIFPLTLFQATVLHLVIFSIAFVFIGGTLLFERVKDLLWTAPDEEGELGEEVNLLQPNGRSSDLQRPLPPRREALKVGRNDPCPCGSGKKYKFCCLTKL